jgi:hypothetical protein
MVAIAQLIQTSIGPSSASTLPAARSTASWSATSTTIGNATPPLRSTSEAAACSPSWPRASRPTRHARRPNARAVARPIPAEAPVMTTQRTGERRFSGVANWLRIGGCLRQALPPPHARYIPP